MLDICALYVLIGFVIFYFLIDDMIAEHPLTEDEDKCLWVIYILAALFWFPLILAGLTTGIYLRISKALTKG
jgi:phosphoglycerol transferase MdoB-like AlkP superfamily enzyme